MAPPALDSGIRAASALIQKNAIHAANVTARLQPASVQPQAQPNNLQRIEARIFQAQGIGPTVAQNLPSSDPVVDQLVSDTIEFTNATHLTDPSYHISETLNDPNLTQAQKDEYLARLVEISRLDNHTTLEGDSVNAQTSDKLRTAFEDIGDSWSGHNTPELRDAVRDSISRSADNGRLTATDLHGLFNAERGGSTDGIRYLMSGITNTDTLHSLSTNLLNDAKAAGFDQSFSPGPGLLVAAADFANMAAAQGRPAAANAVVAEIHAQTRNMSPSAAAAFIREMNFVADSDRFGGPQTDRAGFDVLSRLLNNATTNTPAGREAADALFANLVRSDPSRWSSDGAALNRLGDYFNANLSRLLQNDWRLDGPNSGEQSTRVIQDFMQNVMLDPNYENRDATATAISNEMTRLSGIVGNESLPREVRETAAASFGTLMGSMQEAGRLYIAEARGSAEDKIASVRMFTDILTGKLLKAGGPVGAAVGGEFVDAAWGALADHAENGARGDAEERIGGLTDLAQIFRHAMADLDSFVSNTFDDRLDQYYDGPGG